MNERMDANTNSPFYHAARGLRKAKNDAGKLLISRHDWILTTDTYAPELNKRCRPHLKPTNKSYRTDETYIKVKGEDKYLYRAVDSSGQTIDFLLTAKRDTAAAKRFFRKALSCSANPMPRVVNVDKNPADPAAVEGLKEEGFLPRRVRLRQCKYLNNVVEQDHRRVKAG